jgi:hypothetical protein
VSLDTLLNRFDERHQQALRWFHDRAGTIQPWPSPLPNETYLVTKAKGIHKPRWTEYALSVRQVMSSLYNDGSIQRYADGSWTYMYHQEESPDGLSDSLFTNAALLCCLQDGVPVGVLIQVEEKPRVKYEVLGLAFVRGWEGGYFFLESISSNSMTLSGSPRAELKHLQQLSLEQDGSFEPANILDGRQYTLASIVRRQGQQDFRNRLLIAYERRCAVSGLQVPEVLEAAHIVPYRGISTNHVQNGLLLRADLHTLFDVGLVSINSANMSVLISPSLRGSEYEAIEGCKIYLPQAKSDQPSIEALDQHRHWAGL